MRGTLHELRQESLQRKDKLYKVQEEEDHESVLHDEVMLHSMHGKEKHRIA